MSTHNIGFYEEISKIIPELSSNIIKYALYLWEQYKDEHQDRYYVPRHEKTGFLHNYLR